MKSGGSGKLLLIGLGAIIVFSKFGPVGLIMMGLVLMLLMGN